MKETAKPMKEQKTENRENVSISPTPPNEIPVSAPAYPDESEGVEELPAYIAERKGVYEAALQKQWSEIPEGMEFPLHAGGRSFCILSRGIFNHGAGPDFRNAKLSIDGIIRHGDVEIHCKTSDWAKHNHQDNPEYRQVILHAVGLDDRSAAAGPKLPMVPLYILPEKYAVNPELPPHGQEGLCTHFFARLNEREILQFVLDAGLDRLRGKSRKLIEDPKLSVVKYGVEKIFLLRLFELIGVPNNREQFQALALRYLTYYPDVRAEHSAAILWGESGSLPDPSQCDLPADALEPLQKLWDEWWGVRLKHLEPLSFNRRCRPMNSIERRIALLAQLIERFGECPLQKFADIISTLDTESAVKRITADYLNIPTDGNGGFWEEHTSFFSAKLKHPATLLGRGRMLELFVDAILPPLHALASVNGNAELVKKIESVYLALPKMPTNSVIQRTAELCFPGREGVFKTAAAQQGLLHIGKTWCERLSLDCKVCPIYHLV